MPVFYFDIRDGMDVDEDEEGVELPDFEAARAQAFAAAEELRAELGPSGMIELEILDENGNRLLTVPVNRARGGRGR
jgi:hypothetical protein